MIVESYEDIIHLSGALKSNFWETIHTAISLTLKRHPTGVVIDCSGITECTPDGAETFRDAMDFIERFDARIIVAAVPDAVLEVLKSVPEVRSQLPIAESIEDARRSLDLLVPREQPSQKKRQHAEVRNTIVLLLSGDDRDREGVLAASRMADNLSAEVALCFVIVVPRDLPIQSPLPRQEEEAVRAFELARTELSSQNIETRVVLERGRDVASALDEVIEEQKAGFLVVSLSSRSDGIEEDVKLAKSILTKVEVAVVFTRAAVVA